MEVRTIMSRNPVSEQADASLDQVIRAMDTHGVRHLPILDGTDLVGVLSDRDLLSATGWLPEARRDVSAGGCARDLLKGKPVPCSPDDSVVMIAVDLSSRMIGCLPVLEQGELVGIVTEMDLLDAYVDLSAEENASDRLRDPVADHMSTQVVSLAPESTLGEAVQLGQEHSVRHFPVVKDEQLVGFLSDRDLRKARGRGAQESTSISELMSTDVLTISPRDSLLGAATCFLEAKISGLPVVDEERLVGILTLVDLLDHCITNLRLPDKP